MTDLSNIEIFTVTEVNDRLPLVRRVMHDLRDAWIRRRDVKRRLRLFRRAAARHGSPEILETVESLEAEDRGLDGEISTLEHEIHQIGGIVKDPGRGVVNFFSERRGSLVFLSWMLGEDDVSYWHELDAGLTERRLLQEKAGLTRTE